MQTLARRRQILQATVALAAMVVFGTIGRRAGAVGQTPSCGPAITCTALDPSRVAWLKELIGESTHAAALAGHFDDLINDVAPDAVYHLGVDMPFSAALRIVLHGAGEPITARANRYVSLSACDSPACTRARVLLWSDLDTGLEIGAIDFAPSNGEPTPTLTIFSRQVMDAVTRRVQLPAGFIEDLATWSRGSRRRGGSTPARYFVNHAGLKTVVMHDEDNCHGADQSALAATLCASMNLDAADQDVAAAYYVLLNTFPDGTPMRAALKTDEDKWVADRRTTCGAGSDGPAIACRIKAARERAGTLTDLYLKSPR
jgi:uncharacterized protein YecT (DUF1311 family)